MPTPHIFDFDPSNLADFNAARLNRALTEHPAIMLNHLRIATALSGWADRLEEDETGFGQKHDEGYVSALREVTAHLRQGDYLPDGPMLQEGA